MNAVGTNRRPTVGDGVGGLPLSYRKWIVVTAIGAEECLTLRVEAGEGSRAGEVGEVVAPFPVFGFVVEDAIFNFHLADVEVALVVGGVVPGVPQAKFNGGEEGEG